MDEFAAPVRLLAFMLCIAGLLLVAHYAFNVGRQNECRYEDLGRVGFTRDGEHYTGNLTLRYCDIEHDGKADYSIEVVPNGKSY